MAAYVNTILTFPHDHIKITTKLQNDHHSEPPGISLSASPITEGLKKLLEPGRRDRDVDHVVRQPRVVDENWEGYLSSSGSP